MGTLIDKGTTYSKVVTSINKDASHADQLDTSESLSEGVYVTPGHDMSVLQTPTGETRLTVPPTRELFTVTKQRE
jgi:hypothetical protein